MADAQRTIDLVFNGVDRTGAATAAALQNTQKFAGSIQTATQPIADFTASAVKLEAGLLGAGAAITAFAVSSATEFQSSLADLQKVLSDTDSIEQYRDLALELSDVYGVSATDVVQAIADYKQAGFTAKEAGELTKAGLDAVIAGSVDATLASDRLVASLKGFGAEAGLSVDIVDLLNQVSNEYAASFGELLIGFSEFSPIAKNVGLSLQETVGILTPGIEVFRSGSEVARSLRTAFNRLTGDTSGVAEALATLGVKQKEANGDLRSGRDIYFDVAEALQTVDDNQKNFLAGQLAGSEQSARFLAVIDGLDTSLRIAGEGFEFAGSAAKEVAVQLATAEVAGERAKTAFRNLFINFGTPLLEESTGISNAITKIFQALGASAVTDSGIGEVVQFIEGELSGLQETLETIATNLPAALDQADLSGFADGVSAVSSAIRELFGNIDLTSVDGLARAVTIAGNAFNGLSQFTGGVIDSFGPLLDQITSIGSGLTEINPELFKTAGNIAGFATQANLLAGALVDIVPAIEALLAILIVRQGGGLAGALLSAGSALSGPSGLITKLGQAGLVGAAGGAGFAVGALANKLAELSTGASISTALTDFAISLGLIDDEATNLADSINDVDFSDTGLSAEEAGRQIKAADAEMARLAGTAQDSSKKVFNFSTGLLEASTAAESNAEFFRDGVGVLLDYDTGLEQVVDSSKNLASAGRESAGTFSVISTEANKAAQSVLDLSNAGAEFQFKFAIAQLEAQTAIATASIEANAQKTVAAFESIGTSVESTGNSLNELFGLLGDDSVSKFDKLGIKEQIEIENERREESLRLQKRLTEEQIKSERARREALEGGQGLITVKGDGLAPHLEAFMYSILEAIQVRVNQDGYEMLLGAG